MTTRRNFIDATLAVGVLPVSAVAAKRKLYSTEDWKKVEWNFITELVSNRAIAAGETWKCWLYYPDFVCVTYYGGSEELLSNDYIRERLGSAILAGEIPEVYWA